MMIELTLTRRVESALQALDEAAPLITVIDALYDRSELADSRMSQIADGSGNKIADNANALHSDFASLNSLTRSQNARAIFRDIERLTKALSDALCEGVDHAKYVKEEVILAIERFADAYNMYVAYQTAVNALPLLLASRRAKAALAHLRGFLTYIQTNTTSLFNDESEAELSIVLLKISDLADFANKLLALQKLYNEIANLLDIATASHPLRIGKIESGSLWSKVFGDMRVIGLMIKFIEGATSFMHRNYTKEGKIAAIPTKIESLNAVLDFTNRLKESGIDVSIPQEALAKSALVIAENLNELVSDQPVVEINGRTHSVGGEVQKALLGQSAPKRLSHNVSHDSDVKS